MNSNLDFIWNLKKLPYNPLSLCYKSPLLFLIWKIRIFCKINLFFDFFPLIRIQKLFCNLNFLNDLKELMNLISRITREYLLNFFLGWIKLKIKTIWRKTDMNPWVLSIKKDQRGRFLFEMKLSSKFLQNNKSAKEYKSLTNYATMSFESS